MGCWSYFYGDFDESPVSSADDVGKILKRLIEEKMDGLVFDLRNNGGGSLEGVRRMTKDAWITHDRKTAERRESIR